METTETIHTRISSDLRKDVEKILSNIGLNMSEAIRLFLTQVRNQHAIPFALTDNRSEAHPQDWVLESAKDLKQGTNVKSFSSVDDAMDWLNQ